MIDSAPASFAGWAFLVFAGVALPIAAAAFAMTERRRDKITLHSDAAPTSEGPSRPQIYLQALFTHAILLGGAVLTARAEHVALFPHTTIGVRDILAAGATLGVVVAVGELSWRARSVAARERLWVRRILPHTPTERRLWLLVSAGAAVAEEIAYRGVFVAVVAAMTGSLPAAVIASAAAFAAVHAPQGFAGIGYVFAIALLHQALVAVTGTLLFAIVVHFTYDVLAGLWLAKRHGLTALCGLSRFRMEVEEGRAEGRSESATAGSLIQRGGRRA